MGQTYRNGRALRVAAAVLAMVAAAGGAAGQEGPAFGVKGGLNLASFRGDASLDTGSLVLDPGTRTGLALGAFVAFPAGATVVVQPEVLYTQKGAVYSAGSEELAYKADYLEVPLLLKLRLGGGRTRGALFAGPAAAFRLSAEVARKGAEDGDSTDVSEQVRSVDWGLVLGGGVDLDAGSGTLTFEGRYTLALKDLRKDPEPDETVSGFNPRNGVLSILVGFAF